MQIGAVLEGLSLKERQNLDYMINYTAHLFHFALEKKHLRGKSSEIVNRAFLAVGCKQRVICRLYAVFWR